MSSLSIINSLMFSEKNEAEVLAPYCPYDLQINLEEDAQLLVGFIYSLSAFEQEALKEFIEENLNTDFI